jgi:hypothetical protein
MDKKWQSVFSSVKMFFSTKTLTKEEDITAEKKIAQKRLTVLQVAERIRNLSEACRRHSVSRSQFYAYKRAFQEKGFNGLPKSFSNEILPGIKKKFLFSILYRGLCG